MSDLGQLLSDQIRAAFTDLQPLVIRGNNSKAFYGNTITGQDLDVTGHTGIISYEPSELVLTARAGTKLSEIKEVLAQHGQMLAFEPPSFGDATLGGTIACNLSGPRRPYAGAARDFVLGCRIINGKGEILKFGAEVMKNVAGYDVSRLMTGAMGTLGVLLDISLKVLPIQQQRSSLRIEIDAKQALNLFSDWRQKPLPITAACHDGNALTVRLAGSTSALSAAKNKIGGEQLAYSTDFWQQVREHEHDFFKDERPLWRLSIPSASNINIEGDQFIDWGGAQRWLLSKQDAKDIRSIVENAGGHASLFRGNKSDIECFHPLQKNMLTIQQLLKKAFDPQQILNPGKMYNTL